MLLQIAFDSPEHLALLPRVKGIADIVEIGTPVLKRFGIGPSPRRASSARTLVLADTKTVDGGRLEADMVFGAGAAFMTVLSCASSATHAAVGRVAADFGATVVVDTITESGKAELLPPDAAFPKASAMSRSIRRPMRAGRRSLDRAYRRGRRDARRGFRVSLAGGIGPRHAGCSASPSSPRSSSSAAP